MQGKLGCLAQSHCRGRAFLKRNPSPNARLEGQLLLSEVWETWWSLRKASDNDISARAWESDGGTKLAGLRLVRPKLEIDTGLRRIY